MLRKKGIIFTLDAIFALMAALTIISASLFYMGQVGKIPFNKQALGKISQDSLTILEKDGTLGKAVEIGSAATLSSFLNSLPSNLCGKIEINDASKNNILAALKPGCTGSNELVISVRAFVGNNFNVYYARMEIWYKEV